MTNKSYIFIKAIKFESFIKICKKLLFYNKALEYHIFEDSIIFSIFSLFIKDRMPYTKYKWLNQFTIIVVKIQ